MKCLTCIQLLIVRAAICVPACAYLLSLCLSQESLCPSTFPTLPQLLCTLVSYTDLSPLLQATCFKKPFLTSVSRTLHSFFALRIIYQFLSSSAYKFLVLYICVLCALLKHGPHRDSRQERQCGKARPFAVVSSHSGA